METKMIKVPQVGDVVLYRPAVMDLAARNNSTLEIPAIIVRVWGPAPGSAVNLKCIPDGPGTLWRTSINHQTLGISQNQVMKEAFPVIGDDQGSWRYQDEDLMVSAGGDQYDKEEPLNEPSATTNQ